MTSKLYNVRGNDMSDTADPFAMAHDVDAALTAAGLPVSDGTGGGVVASVVNEGNAGERVVMLSWLTRDDGTGDEPGILLPAVAEVLRTRGFVVERHSIGAAFIVTGRADAQASNPSDAYAREAVATLRRAVNTERDFPGWLAGVLATLASCYIDGSHALIAGRPGSWEAGHLARLLAGTVGGDDEMIDHYATAPGGPRDGLSYH